MARSKRKKQTSSRGREARTAPLHGDRRPEGGRASRSDRGRSAEHPAEIPKSGWRDILLRVKRQLGNEHITLVASGLALYALLAVFPALAAAVSIYGIFSSPTDVLEHMSAFASVLPPQAWQIISGRLQEIASRNQGTLSIGAAVTLLLALWSARSGMVALMAATNIAYKEREKRSFIRQILVSLVFTIGAILGFLAMLLLAVALPLALAAFGASDWVRVAVAVLRWVLLGVIAMLGLAIVYRYAPARDRARWRWVSWGSAIATVLWLAGSALFALYVRNFGSYGNTYGALGGVIVLLLWFYHTSFIIVLGAEINAEMEHQTARDTTEGPEKPMGERGAYVADTLGRSP